MQSNEVLLKNGFTDRCENNELAARFEETALRIVREFNAEVARIRKTFREDLVPVKITEKAQAALAELESGPGSIVRLLGNQWATSMQRLERESGLSPSTDPSQTAREIWIANRLSTMTSSEQLATLRRAIEVGDTATLKAALHAPPALKIIHLDPRVVEEVRTLWYKTTVPEAVSEYEQLTYAHQCETGNYASAVAAVKQLAGLTENLLDMVEQQQAQQAGAEKS